MFVICITGSLIRTSLTAISVLVFCAYGRTKSVTVVLCGRVVLFGDAYTNFALRKSVNCIPVHDLLPSNIVPVDAVISHSSNQSHNTLLNLSFAFTTTGIRSQRTTVFGASISSDATEPGSVFICLVL